MKLTEEQLNLNAYDFVRNVMDRPLTDEEAEYILWEKTPFPMASPEEVADSLLELKENQDGI
jgi:hypothetical protein